MFAMRRSFTLYPNEQADEMEFPAFTLSDFQISRDDRQLSLRIRAEGVGRPVSVRYAWTDWSDRANVCGLNGLPLEPFFV